MGTIRFAIHGDPDRYRTAIGIVRTRSKFAKGLAIPVTMEWKWIIKNGFSFYDFDSFHKVENVLYILHGLSSKTQVLWKLSCLLEEARQSLACIRLCLVCPSCLLGAACKSLAYVRLCPLGQSCLHAPSTCCGPDVCNIRTSYVSHQCTSSDGNSAAPCLLRRLVILDWLALAS
ncbi:hypothetical protein Tco_1358632 [Tanacetum coccineum]